MLQHKIDVHSYNHETLHDIFRFNSYILFYTVFFFVLLSFVKIIHHKKYIAWHQIWLKLNDKNVIILLLVDFIFVVVGTDVINIHLVVNGRGCENVENNAIEMVAFVLS